MQFIARGYIAMGKSKTSSEVVTDIMVKSVTKAVQNCTTSTVAGQRLTISNIKNSTVSNLVMQQRIAVTIKCAVNMNLANKIQEDIATQLMQSDTQTSQAVLSGITKLFGGGNKTSNTTKLLTQLRRDFSVESIQEMINAVNSSQDFTINKVDNSVITNVSMDQQLDFVAQALTEIISSNELVTAIRNTADVKSTSEEKNPISDVVLAAGDSAGKVINSAGDAGSKVIESTGDAAGAVLSGAGDFLKGPLAVLVIILIIIGIMAFLFRGTIDSVAKNVSAKPNVSVGRGDLLGAVQYPGADDTASVVSYNSNNSTGGMLYQEGMYDQGSMNQRGMGFSAAHNAKKYPVS